MPLVRVIVMLALLLLCLGQLGCATRRRVPLTQILPPAAPLNQVLTEVNNNTARVRSVLCTNGTLQAAGTPLNLRANLALERPRNFRLRADTAFTGAELDVGSNADQYWLWVRRNNPPSMYFGRHDQFAASSARRIFPIEPEMLSETLGLVSFQPNEQVQGPFPRGGDLVEVRRPRLVAGEALNQVIVLDIRRGVVTEQHLYGATGQRVATVMTSEYERDPASGAALPHRIDVDWPLANLQFRLDLPDLLVNTLGPEQASLWQRPSYPGSADVDLATVQIQAAPASNTQNLAPGISNPPPAVIPVNPGMGGATLPIQNSPLPATSQNNTQPAALPSDWTRVSPAGQPIGRVDPAVQPASWSAAPGGTGVNYVPNPSFDIRPAAK
ncbi:MAG: hypothetical protein SFX18_15510 [Pirellulales bacterium]|nr:hypothetical protein [Pirellulales bacterium]